ncbi:MAG: hypothetical protein U0L55_06950, partial [Acutalibacteraceae bacterium]|nr:hypothetical protein [Acutalibacteraceae bacterium]
MKKLTSVVLSVLMVVSMLSCLFVGSASAEGTAPNLIPNGNFESYNNGDDLEVELPTADTLPNFSSGGKWGANVNDGYYRATWAETIKDKDGNKYQQVSRVRDEIRDYNTFKVVENANIAHSGIKYLYVEGNGTSSLGLEGLEKSSDYELSFYWRYAEGNESTIAGMAITTTVNICNATLGEYEGMNYSLQNVVKADKDHPIIVARNTDLTPNQDNSWKLATITFNSKDFNKLYFVMAPPDGGTPKILIDDMVLNKVKSKINCFGDAEFYNVDDKKLDNEQAYVGIKTLVDGKETSAIYEEQSVTATVDYDKTSGAYSFLGWYDNQDNIYSTDETINFTAKSGETYTPHFSSTNLLGSSGSFESFAKDTYLRVTTPTANDSNLPTYNKWGWSKGSGYYGKVWDGKVYDKTGKEYTQTSAGSLDANRFANGSCNVKEGSVEDNTTHTGNKALYLNTQYVPSFLAIEGLEAETDYVLSFYWRHADDSNNVLSALGIVTSVNLGTASTNTDLKINLGNELDKGTTDSPFVIYDDKTVRNIPSSNKTWQKAEIQFNSGAIESGKLEKLYLVVSGASSDVKILLDDMVCTKVVKVDVDSPDLRLGTVVKPQSNSFIQGSSVTVKATAFEGNKFDGWYVGDKLVCADGTYTFNVTDNVILTPKFSGNNVVPYEHFANNGLDGTFEKGDVGNWQFYNTKGANLTWCNATVKTDQHYEGSKSLSLDSRYQYSILKLTNLMPHSRYTLSFNFKLPTTYEEGGVLKDTRGKITVVAITTADAINPNDKSKLISKTSSDIVCTGDWQKFELSFISNNDTELNLMLKFDGDGYTTQLNIDDLKLMVDKEVSHYYAASCDRYCTFCGKTRDINVEHTYSNACDTTCDVCGNTRTVGAHVYDNACDSTCNICGAKRTVSNHEYSSNCDTLCDICGSERTVTAPHTYDNACDDTCNVCYTKRTVGAHIYDNDCDTDCNICGATREVGAHVYDNACDTTCNICGATREVGAHVYDNACDTTCNICGAIREVAPHVYDNACDTTCNICGAIRTVGAHVYDNACDTTCNICGAIRTVGAHVYDNACDTDCNECGVTRIVGAHIYDNACDTDCNICGAKRTVGDHIYYGACDSICKICGNERKDTAAHTYTNACDKSCNVCGATRTVGDHVYDNACDTDCNECGVTREVDPHVYDNACDTTCNI